MKPFDQIELQNQIEAIRQEVFRITNGEVEEIRFDVLTGDRTTYRLFAECRGNKMFASNPDLEIVLNRIERQYKFILNPFLDDRTQAFGLAVRALCDKVNKSLESEAATKLPSRNRLSNIDEHFDKTFE